jgi:hypothetical protein
LRTRGCEGDARLSFNSWRKATSRSGLVTRPVDSSLLELRGLEQWHNDRRWSWVRRSKKGEKGENVTSSLPVRCQLMEMAFDDRGSMGASENYSSSEGRKRKRVCEKRRKEEGKRGAPRGLGLGSGFWVWILGCCTGGRAAAGWLGTASQQQGSLWASGRERGPFRLPGGLT